ncbi:hypothetical protein BQ8482_180068 [Mesorhizobium delmotii]|uniref:Uncharacterized protein n=1 Tax=Mesorhizobium delmotii TaxID=1631247 RepID=A0A2P9AI94_9HYPH|nr:hypothetical protein BQ8482_180068 [Mesorhizobium delmotii]
MTPMPTVVSTGDGIVDAVALKPLRALGDMHQPESPLGTSASLAARHWTRCAMPILCLRSVGAVLWRRQPTGRYRRLGFRRNKSRSTREEV